MAINQQGSESPGNVTMEWGIFRKGDASSVVPAENLTYSTRENAERVIKRSYRQPQMWEARGRIVGPWETKARDDATGIKAALHRLSKLDAEGRQA